jgi:hypothetical protein
MKFFNWIIIVITLASCESNHDKIKGIWISRSHDYYDSKIGENIKDADMPFQMLAFIGDTVYVDLNKSLYSIKDDQLIFSLNNKILRFSINVSDRFLILHSKNFSPGEYSFYYFIRHDPE